MQYIFIFSWTQPNLMVERISKIIDQKLKTKKKRFFHDLFYVLNNLFFTCDFSRDRKSVVVFICRNVKMNAASENVKNIYWKIVYYDAIILHSNITFSTFNTLRIIFYRMKKKKCNFPLQPTTINNKPKCTLVWNIRLQYFCTIEWKYLHKLQCTQKTQITKHITYFPSPQCCTFN